MPAVRYSPIADYALIGDCHTAALVSRDGSVDWYCPSRFDGPALFCRLLDADKGGYWSVAPVAAGKTARRYVGPTNVLETTFTTADGVVRLTDLMPVYDRRPDWGGHDVGAHGRVLRLVEGVSGAVAVSVACKPTFDYARAETRVTPVAGKGAVLSAGNAFQALSCPGVDLAVGADGTLQGTLTVRPGERYWLALSTVPDADAARAALDVPNAASELAETLDYWQRWADRCTYHGPHRDLVLRSALVIKLLTYEPSGAIVAAPTTSLPESIGGVRNWDYRYTWLRDSALMLYAALSVGYDHEAVDFFTWLNDAFTGYGDRKLQIMYTIDGRRELPEFTLDHLAGYRDSRPVRVGNAAANQRQSDIYGELLTTAYVFFHAPNRPYIRTGGPVPGVTTNGLHGPLPQAWRQLSRLVNTAATVWTEPGEGIWEVRGGPQHFLYSKLMCWAALDRGVRLAEEFSLDAPLDSWRATRETIRAAILEHGWNAERGAFTQAFGSTELDASALAIPRVGFLPASDPRVRSTVAAIQKELSHDGLVQRYRAPDGLPGEEGAFLLCSFWLVDALAYEGRLTEAHDLFVRLCGYANDLGLLAEEVDPRDGSLLGNFPQGFTHLALIDSAVNLAACVEGGAETKSTTEPERIGPAQRQMAQPGGVQVPGEIS